MPAGRSLPRAGTWLGAVWRTGVALVLLAALARITGCMEGLFYQPTPGPTPLPPGFPGAQSVSFRSGDGTVLHGWFLPGAPGKAEGGSGPEGRPRLPTVLHVHGNAGNVDSHLWFTEYLPGQGFNLFLFDYRGYGESEGRARRRDDLIADTEAALDALLARNDVDPERIGMYGQSLGGGIGLVVMARRPEIRAAVIEAAFTSWREIAADVISGGRSGAVARLLARLFISDARRPVDAIATIDRPLLILHGDGDTTIPVSHGRALAAAAPNAELVELAGGEHNSLRETHPEIERLVVEFLRRNLAPALETAPAAATDRRAWEQP